MRRIVTTIIILFSLSIIVFVASSCALGSSDEGEFDLNQYSVDDNFLYYYSFLGGEELLGPPISPLFSSSGIANFIGGFQFRRYGRGQYLGGQVLPLPALLRMVNLGSYSVL